MIYILGGRGFVGSGFTRLFSDLGLACQIIDRANYQQMAGSDCDVLINANGNSSKILAGREPMTDFDANVRSTRLLLEDFNPGFYIHLSSCDVYEDCSGPGTTSETTAVDFRRQSPYGFHKLMAEHIAQHKCEKWLIARLGGFVGPGLKKNAIFDILFGEKLWLHPESELQFIHTDDSARLIWSLYEQGLTNEVVNVCGRGTVRLQEVMDWSRRQVAVEPGSRKARYEVNIARLEQYGPVPESRVTVEKFVRSALQRDDA